MLRHNVAKFTAILLAGASLAVAGVVSVGSIVSSEGQVNISASDGYVDMSQSTSTPQWLLDDSAWEEHVASLGPPDLSNLEVSSAEGEPAPTVTTDSSRALDFAADVKAHIPLDLERLSTEEVQLGADSSSEPGLAAVFDAGDGWVLTVRQQKLRYPIPASTLGGDSTVSVEANGSETLRLGDENPHNLQVVLVRKGGTMLTASLTHPLDLSLNLEDVVASRPLSIDELESVVINALDTERFDQE